MSQSFHINNSLGKILGALVPATAEWKDMQAQIKSRETNCNNLKSEIAVAKENQEEETKILKSLSSHDIRGSYKSVLERTGIEDKYSTRCQWLLEHDNFITWYTPGSDSVLWLNGTIGRGKTTLMARAIQEMKHSAITQLYALPVAIFFFRKAESLAAALKAEDCLRSLVRQLAWDNSTDEVDPIVQKAYNDFQFQHADDTVLQMKECQKILKSLISAKETYIMIDGLDECQDPDKLLSELLVLFEDVDKRQPLHVMLCGRNDQNVSDSFPDCLLIAVNSADIELDQEFYIDQEVDTICRNRKGSWFFRSEKDFPAALKKVLKEKGGGLFRWIEIQIQIFRVTPFKTEDQVQCQIDRLERHSGVKEDELDKEYARLLAVLEHSEPNGERAMKLLKLIACSDFPFTVDHLAEAINASEYEKNTKITSDDVRQILVGFISEKRKNFSFYSDFNALAVEFAHSSVSEYLMRNKAHDFSILAQHKATALLCFLRIKSLPHMSTVQQITSSLSDIASYFLAYSCLRWPAHCRRAFDEDGTPRYNEIHPWRRVQSLEQSDLSLSLLSNGFQTIQTNRLWIC